MADVMCVLDRDLLVLSSFASAPALLVDCYFLKQTIYSQYESNPFVRLIFFEFKGTSLMCSRVLNHFWVVPLMVG